jgi:PRD1 phage membrane DNA delivery
MGPLGEQLSVIALAIVGVAIIAVLVSQRANTAGVFQAAGSAFSNALGVAEAPVTGAAYTPNLGYPGNNSAFGAGM